MDTLETDPAGARIPLSDGTDLVIRVGFNIEDEQVPLLGLPAYLKHMAQRVVETALVELQKCGVALNAGPPDPESVKWVPMRKGKLNGEKAKLVADLHGIPVEKVLGDDVWLNDRYQALVRRVPSRDPDATPLYHISIRRMDRGACHDWRDFQRIKNDILRPECEAVEIYPAESRLADSANQYHLWGFGDPTFRFPFGFRERLVSGPDMAGLAKQRDWHDDDRPDDLTQVVPATQTETVQ
jgi:hypothetical protein